MPLFNEIINERYKVISPLGRGGMADVTLVEDLKLGRQVALKTIKAASSTVSAFRARFRKEAQICASVNHPNIIAVLDFGTLDDGSLFYTMDYLPLPDLGELIESGEEFSQERVVKIIRRLADALQVCHDKGIVHRDIKAANVLLKDDDEPVLSDFGLVYASETTRMTATGDLVGTPLFLPPEALTSSEIDGRSDIYQLGLLCHELLTGRRLFGESGTMAELLSAIISPDFDPPSMILPRVSDEMRDIISLCVARDVEDRFASMEELKDALDGKKRPERKVDGDRGRDGKSKTLGGVKRSGSGKVASRDKLHSPSKLSSTVKRSYWHYELPVVLLVLVFVLFLTSRQKTEVYTAKNFKFVAEQDSLIVQWKSDEPYVSRLVIDGHRAGASRIATSTHRITVSGLEPGKRYEISVLYPNGERSLSKKVTTATIDKSVKLKEKFVKALERFFNLPTAYTAKGLFGPAKGIEPDELLPLLFERLDECTNILQDEKRAFDERFSKTTLVYSALVKIVFLTMNKDYLFHHRYARFIDKTITFFNEFRLQEDIQRKSQKSLVNFRITSVGIGGHGYYQKMLKTIDEILGDVPAEVLNTGPLALQIYWAFIKCEMYSSSVALPIAHKVREKLLFTRKRNHHVDLLLALAFYTEQRCYDRLMKTDEYVKCCEAQLEASTELQRDWYEKGYGSTNWLMQDCHLNLVREFRKTKKLTKAEIDDLAERIVLTYKGSAFARWLTNCFSNSPRLNNEEQVQLKKRLFRVLEIE